MVEGGGGGEMSCRLWNTLVEKEEMSCVPKGRHGLKKWACAGKAYHVLMKWTC